MGKTIQDRIDQVEALQEAGKLAAQRAEQVRLEALAAVEEAKKEKQRQDFLELQALPEYQQAWAEANSKELREALEAWYAVHEHVLYVDMGYVVHYERRFRFMKRTTRERVYDRKPIDFRLSIEGTLWGITIHFPLIYDKSDPILSVIFKTLHRDKDGHRIKTWVVETKTRRESYESEFGVSYSDEVRLIREFVCFESVLNWVALQIVESRKANQYGITF